MIYFSRQPDIELIFPGDSNIDSLCLVGEDLAGIVIFCLSYPIKIDYVMCSYQLLFEVSNYNRLC